MVAQPMTYLLFSKKDKKWWKKRNKIVSNRFTKTNMPPRPGLLRLLKKKASRTSQRNWHSWNPNRNRKLRSPFILAKPGCTAPNKVHIHGHSSCVWSWLRLVADSDVCGWLFPTLKLLPSSVDFCSCPTAALSVFAVRHSPSPRHL